MNELAGFTDAELGTELGRRKREREAAHWQSLNERYGPCPECGATLASVETDSVQEHWTANNWHGWPVPPPEDWHDKTLVAQEFDTKLTCANGHVRWTERTVRVHESAAVREP